MPFGATSEGGAQGGLEPFGGPSLDAVAPSNQRGRSPVALGSRVERVAALGLPRLVLAGGPLGALCRGKCRRPPQTAEFRRRRTADSSGAQKVRSSSYQAPSRALLERALSVRHGASPGIGRRNESGSARVGRIGDPSPCSGAAVRMGPGGFDSLMCATDRGPWPPCGATTAPRFGGCRRRA